MAPSARQKFLSSLSNVLELLAPVPMEPAPRAALRRVAERMRRGEWSVLVSGLRSVGKSSFVSVLWGDADLLPTAVRDCTQTNTLVRVPAPGETERSIGVEHLTREQALEFAARDFSAYKLQGFLAETLGPFGPRWDELPPEPLLRALVRETDRIFQERPALAVLQEPLTDERAKIEQFLAFIDSPEYRPGLRVEASWSDRRRHLMGERKPDGRSVDVGKLLAYRHVEILRASPRWQGEPPRVIDTPWVPAFHDARRARLIREAAREADLILVLALPERLEPEPWLLEHLKERPERARRTLVAFNQVDMVDTATLFGRGGFAQIFAEIAEDLGRLGVRSENFFLACARLPFLEMLPAEEATLERAKRLRAILEKIRGLFRTRPEGAFKAKMLAACDPSDAGIETLRARMQELRDGVVWDERVRTAVGALETLAASESPGKIRDAAKNALAQAANLSKE